jgi:Icc-related predicted phosphoesterase
VKIQIVSDLHLEFSDINIKNNKGADVLILGGDIMVASKVHKPESEYGKRFRDFLKRVSFQFPHVVYVMGNHEFYDSGKWVGGIEEMRQACGVHDNIYLLERDCKQIDDVLFVGGTLWTDMNKGDPLTLHSVRDMMNDYRAIKNDEKGYTPLKPYDSAVRHRETKEYIKLIASENKDKKIVVVGHHAPSYQSVHEQYRGDTLMNGAYYSSLEDIMLDNPHIKLWTHGHMHNTFDYMVGETRVVCNPRGYHQPSGWSEDTGWDPEFIVEV